MNEIKQHQLKHKEQLMLIEFKKQGGKLPNGVRAQSVLAKEMFEEDSRDNSEEAAVRAIQATPLEKKKLFHNMQYMHQSPFLE